MKLIDLTHVLYHQSPVYPGDSETRLVRSHTVETDGYCNHELAINMHAGTHIDGPMHLSASGLHLSDFPPNVFIGQGTLLDVSGMDIIDYKAEYEACIEEGTILILYTGHGAFYGQERYFADHPVISRSFAELVVRKKIKLIGLDTPSPDKYPYDIHRYLFAHEVLIAENLANVDQLLQVPSFEIIALPMSIQADSAIARIVARETGQ